jgi:hypothetical protein
MGLKKAAVARLCLNPDIYRSMPDVCYQYLPTSAAPAPLVVAPIGPAVGYANRDIWLVEGSTGQDRLCKDYDAPQQRCRLWAGVVMHHHSAAPKKGLRQKNDAVPNATTASPGPEAPKEEGKS